eukprot:jgi/Ulvmu1/446/UM001_0453.1
MMGQTFAGQSRGELQDRDQPGSRLEGTARAPASAIQQFLNDHDNDSVCGTDLDNTTQRTGNVSGTSVGQVSDAAGVSTRALEQQMGAKQGTVSPSSTPKLDTVVAELPPPGAVPTSTPTLPGTWRRRKRHGPWALRPPPTLEMPQDPAPSAGLPTTEDAPPGGPPSCALASTDALPPAATPHDRATGMPEAFGSQVPATAGATPAATASGGPAGSTQPVHDEQPPLAEASVSIANTEIQSSVATEPANGVDAMPGTELQQPLAQTEPPDTVPATVPDTVPAIGATDLAHRLDQRLDAAALQCGRAGGRSHGTPDTAIHTTPRTAATVQGGGVAGAGGGGGWVGAGRSRLDGRHTNPGSSGGAARTPHLGVGGGCERPCSGGTAIQDSREGASPDTQPTPVLAQVEDAADGTQVEGAADGMQLAPRSPAGQASHRGGDEGGGGGVDEEAAAAGGSGVAPGESVGGVSGAVSEGAVVDDAAVRETPSGSGGDPVAAEESVGEEGGAAESHAHSAAEAASGAVAGAPEGEEPSADPLDDTMGPDTQMLLTQPMDEADLNAAFAGVGDLAKALCEGLGPAAQKPPPAAPASSPQCGTRTVRRAAEATSPLRTSQQTAAATGGLSASGGALVASRELGAQRDLRASQHSSERSPQQQGRRRTKAQRLAASPSATPSPAKPPQRSPLRGPQASDKPPAAPATACAGLRSAAAAAPVPGSARQAAGCAEPAEPAQHASQAQRAVVKAAAREGSAALAAPAAAPPGGAPDPVRKSGRVRVSSARAAAAAECATPDGAHAAGAGAAARKSKRSAKPPPVEESAPPALRGKRRRGVAGAAAGQAGARGTLPMLVSDAVLATTASPAPPGLETQAAVVALNELRVSRETSAAPEGEPAPASGGSEERQPAEGAAEDVGAGPRKRRRAAASRAGGGVAGANVHAGRACSRRSTGAGAEVNLAVGACAAAVSDRGRDAKMADASPATPTNVGRAKQGAPAGADLDAGAQDSGRRQRQVGKPAAAVRDSGQMDGVKVRGGQRGQRSQRTGVAGGGGRLQRRRKRPVVAIDTGLEDDVSDGEPEAEPPGISAAEVPDSIKSGAAGATVEVDVGVPMHADGEPGDRLAEGGVFDDRDQVAVLLDEATREGSAQEPVQELVAGPQGPQGSDRSEAVADEAAPRQTTPVKGRGGGKRGRKPALAKAQRPAQRRVAAPSAAPAASPPRTQTRRSQQAALGHAARTPACARTAAASQAPSAEAPAASPPLRDRADPLALLSMGLTVPRKLKRKAQTARLRTLEHKPGAVVPDFTHYVAQELVLSLHVLLALASGRPVVSMDWLAASIEAGSAVPAGPYLLEDRKAEKKYGMVLKTTLTSAQRSPLLDGRICYITEDLAESEADAGAGLRLVASAALGRSGVLVESTLALCGAMEDEELLPVVLVKEGADCGNLPLPDGEVEAYTRSQFVQAIARGSFDTVPYWMS